MSTPPSPSAPHEADETGPGARQLRGRFVRGVALFALADLLVKLKGFILMPILTRGLGAGGYGVWSQTTTVAGFMANIGGAGMGVSMNRYLPGLSRDEARGQFWMAMLLVLAMTLPLVALLLGLAAPLAGAAFGGAHNAPFVRLAALLLFFSVVRMHLMIYFRVILATPLYTAVMLLEALLATAGMALAVLKSGALLVVAKVGVGVEGVLCAVALALVARHLGPGRPNFLHARRYWRMGLATVPVGLLNWVLYSADRFFIVPLLGTAAVGVYAVAYNLAYLSIFMVMTPVWLTLPTLVNTFWNQGQQDRALITLRQVFKVSFLFTLPVAGVMVFRGGWLLHHLATRDFGPGAAVIPWVVAAYFLEFVGAHYRVIVGWYEKVQVFWVMFPVAAVVNLTLNALLIPRHGLVGAGMATTAAYGTLLVFDLLYSRRFLKAGMPLAQVGGMALVALGLGWGLAWLPCPGWLAFFAQAAGYALVYLAACLLLGLVKREEVVSLWGLAKPTRNPIGVGESAQNI